MARIGILTCTNATQDLGCASVSCLGDFRKRKGSFGAYPEAEPLELIGIINCPGCPTMTGPVKLLKRIRGITEFRVDAIHFANCVKALCPFRAKYENALKEAFPEIKIVIGTHREHVTDEEFRARVSGLFKQERLTMPDMILNRDIEKK